MTTNGKPRHYLPVVNAPRPASACHLFQFSLFPNTIDWRIRSSMSSSRTRTRPPTLTLGRTPLANNRSTDLSEHRRRSAASFFLSSLVSRRLMWSFLSGQEPRFLRCRLLALALVRSGGPKAAPTAQVQRRLVARPEFPKEGVLYLYLVKNFGSRRPPFDLGGFGGQISNLFRDVGNADWVAEHQLPTFSKHCFRSLRWA